MPCTRPELSRPALSIAAALAAVCFTLSACSGLDRLDGRQSKGEVSLVAAAESWIRGEPLGTSAETERRAGKQSKGEVLLVAAAEGEIRGDALGSSAMPSSPYGDYLAGLVASHEKDISAAADFMLLALENDPDNYQLLQRTFMLAAADGRHVESVRLARRLVEQNPEHTIANMILTVDAVDRGDLTAGQEFLDALPAKGLNKISKPIVEAWLQLGEGQPEAAKTALDRLLESNGFDVLHQLHLAMIQDVEGSPVDAAAAYDEALTKASQASLRLTWLIGNFRERQGSTESAKQLYENYLAENPGSGLFDAALRRLERGDVPDPVIPGYKQGMAEGLFNVAGLLSQERADEIALVHVHGALRLEPELDVARILLGEILESQERSREAIEVYRRIDPASPFTWTARLRIAEQLDRLERTEEAISELEALAADRPEHYEPLFRLGNMLRSKERFDEAVVAYDRAFERLVSRTNRHWTMFYFRGIALERSKEWDRAEKDFLEALELEPEQPYVMNYLAYSWVEQERNLDEAKRMLVRAVELRPNDGYIVDSLGWAYYRLEEFEKAVKQLEKAVELRPQDPVINDHLGDAYWQVGRVQEARFQWRRALSLEPEDDLVPKIEVKIKNGLNTEPKNI